jgi:polyisoprenoid-binding protein YceI
MKRLLPLISIILTTLSFSLPAQAAATTYTFDPSHTSVLWHINHFGFSSPSGKWAADGTLVLDEAKPQDSKVNVLIHVDAMVTGNPELDKHLKGDNFFDVTKYPTATFVSDKVNVTGKKKAKVHGMLTLHGVSKAVTLDVTLNQVGVNPINDKQTVGFTASTKLKRSDFGMSTLLPGLSDEVKIDIEAEAAKA